MPCYDIDGNSVACSIENLQSGKVSVGFGPDYDVALADFKAARSATEDDGGVGEIRNYEGVPHEKAADGKWYPIQIGDTSTRDAENRPAMRPYSPASMGAGYTSPEIAGQFVTGSGGYPTGSGGGSGGGGGRSYAPRYPTTEISPTGDIFTIDPYTGMPKYMGNDPRLATGFSPQQDRNFQVADTRQAQGYNTSERIGSQQFQTGERLGSQQFTGGQNDLNRALTAGQFAANLSLSNEQNRFSADQAYQQARERYTQAQLGAAQQVANNISNTDPGALPAFYAAGGGNIANALASGATGQTDAANLGSARALMAAEMAAAPERFTFNPATFDPRYGMAQQPQPAFQWPQQPQQQGRIVPVAAGLGGPANAQQMAAAQPRQQDYANQGIATAVGQEGGQWTMEGGNWVEQLPGMAQGGLSTGQPVVVGENGPEVVVSSGPFAVLNEQQLGVDPMRLRAPRAADGGVFNRQQMFTAADRPYLNRIRGIRDNVQFANLNPYNVNFQNQLPSQQESFMRGMQTKFGVPVQDTMAEEQRYRLGGTSRGQFSLGV